MVGGVLDFCGVMLLLAELCEPRGLFVLQIFGGKGKQASAKASSIINECMLPFHHDASRQ